MPRTDVEMQMRARDHERDRAGRLSRPAGPAGRDPGLARNLHLWTENLTKKWTKKGTKMDPLLAPLLASLLVPFWAPIRARPGIAEWPKTLPCKRF